MRQPSLRPIALMLTISLVWLGCGPFASDPRPNIVLITIDTLRGDHMTVYGYNRDTTPEIARHLAGAQVFERAFSAASYTSGSVASMLSGLYPSTHGVRDFYRKLPEHVQILPDFLREAGYQTAAVVSNTVLTDEAFGIAERFDYYDDFVDERELNRDLYERRASRTTDAALRWLALERKEDRPHFLWVHYMDPHAPYQVPEDEISVRYSHQGSRPLEAEISQEYQKLPGVTDGLDYVDRYDEEVAYADREVGRLLAAYQERGLLDDALVILTADHGEVLLEHLPNFEHSTQIWDGVLRVPLMVRWPNRTPPRRVIPTSLVDLTPSVLDYLGIPIEGLEGVPFDDRLNSDLHVQEAWARGRKDKPGVPLRSAIQYLEKWTFEQDALGTIHVLRRFKLTDTAKGEVALPSTEENLAPPEKLTHFVAREQQRAAQETRPGNQLRAPKTPPALEPHQRDALRALGYIE